jgi:4'-phosphopantetheinyl transferase
MILDNEAHVWEARPDEVEADRSPDACLSLLSAEEHARHDRFVHERDRRLFRVAHALKRRVLGGWLERPPASLGFVTGTWGRPELDGNPPPLRFNLSHTLGLVTCVVTRRLDCGIDVERADHGRNFRGVAETVLSPGELAALYALPHPLQYERFLALWTLKESVVKALGRGLSQPLPELSIEIDDTAGDSLNGDPVAPGGWRLWRWRPTSEHHAAAAVRNAEQGMVQFFRHGWDGAFDSVRIPDAHRQGEING